MTFGEVGKVLGEKWKNISASEKAKYEEMAKKDKVCTALRTPATQSSSTRLCANHVAEHP